MILSKLKNWFSKHPGWTTTLVVIGLFVVDGYIGDGDVNSQDLSTSVYKATTAIDEVDLPDLDFDLPSVDIVEKGSQGDYC